MGDSLRRLQGERQTAAGLKTLEQVGRALLLGNSDHHEAISD